MVTRKISALVLSYSRTRNLREIVENLRAQPFLDDIHIVHQNIPDDALADAGKVPGTAIHVAPANRYRLARFDAMDCCRHDAVLVQDDDLLPLDLPSVWRAWQQDCRCIAAGLDTGHYKHDHLRRWGMAHEVLLGFGSIVDRRWRGVLGLYRDRFGEDEILLRKADRIFALLTQRPHNIVRARTRNLWGASSGDAEWLRPDHKANVKEARRRCLIEILGLPLKKRDYAADMQ